MFLIILHIYDQNTATWLITTIFCIIITVQPKKKKNLLYLIKQSEPPNPPFFECLHESWHKWWGVEEGMPVCILEVYWSRPQGGRVALERFAQYSHQCNRPFASVWAPETEVSLQVSPVAWNYDMINQVRPAWCGEIMITLSSLVGEH